MAEHRVGTREEWRAAREELAKLEAEHAELGRRATEKRRELPWVPVDKRYEFDTERTGARRSRSCSTAGHSGSVEIDWIEDGSVLRIRQGDPEHPPAAVWIIGRDASETEYSVLYADDRGVSRVYRMNFKHARWLMWREKPEFSQRFNAEMDSDARMIRGRWEKFTDQGTTWEHDFNIDYLREDATHPSS